MSDRMEQAINVAMQVSRRRAAGEKISDQQVIQEHSHLMPFIAEQLRKSAMFSAIENLEENQPEDEIRFTRMVSEDDDDPQVTAAGFKIQSATPAANKQEREPIARTLKFRPSIRPPMATLMVYHDHDRAFDTHPLRDSRTIIGREKGDIVINHDRLMSSVHAEILRVNEDGRWLWKLRDCDSTNGTFVSVDKAPLTNDDELILGSERYKFILNSEGKASLCHLQLGQVIETMLLSSEGSLVGRDKCDEMNAFWDKHLDAKHALIHIGRNGKWYIKNTKSLNGVWYRVKELSLAQTCFFQMGEQRFGFRG